MAYEEIGLANARAAQMLSVDTAGLNYQAVAQLCATQITADGSSPPDFFYEQARGQIVNELQADEEDLALYEQLEAYRQKLGAD